MDKIRVCPQCCIASKNDGTACPYPGCGHIFTEKELQEPPEDYMGEPPTLAKDIVEEEAR